MAFDFQSLEPELRSKGRLMKIFMPSTRWYLHLMFLVRNWFGEKNPKDLQLEKVWIERSDGSGKLQANIYRPPAWNENEDLPIVLYIHGGGYVTGNVEACTSIIRRMIKKRRCIVVSPDYRKAFEQPYPAAIDDCFDALTWAYHELCNADPDKRDIIVAGHSAGGGLTAAVTLRARDQGGINIRFQMPIYPMIDDRGETPSSQNNEAPAWNTKLNEIAWDIYLKDLKRAGRSVPYDAAPARAEDLRGLPPTVTFVSDLDPFLDETKCYVEKIRSAGIPVKFKVFNGGFHGFEFFAPNAEISRRVWEFYDEAFGEGVDGNFELWS